MGALTALGVHFLDEDGNRLNGFGKDLLKVKDIDLSGIHPAVKDAVFTVMCDVKNPLTGKDGATYTFGEQKGGTKEILEQLEMGMEQYHSMILGKLGIDLNKIQGSGAAGGLGAALHAFIGAQLKSGIETILDILSFDRLLEATDLVITGEGRIDWQSAFGKVISGIGMRCKRKGVPAVAIVGGMGKGAEDLYQYGIDSIITTINGAITIEEALSRAEELYLNAAERLFRMIKVGISLKDTN
jgi:glycerate kinase